MSRDDDSKALLEGPALKTTDQADSIIEVIEHACERFADHAAFSCLGRTLYYRELDRLTRRFATWLIEETPLEPGDRFAVVLPNILQYPVAVFGALRAGLVIVNTNPLYSADEMHHQFEDAGVRGVLVFEGMLNRVRQVLERRPLACVVTTGIADLHQTPRRWALQLGMRWKARGRHEPAIPGSVSMRHTLRGALDRPASQEQPCWGRGDDPAVLQYTGGTTGTPKGAILTHRNLIANMRQTGQVLSDVLEVGREVIIAPLPVYHIYTFTVNCMFGCETGNHSVLIPDPRDMKRFIRTLKKQPFSAFIGVNPLFAALCRQKAFCQLDFSRLKLSVSGGMALNNTVAERWEQATGCRVLEGYGMTETSPVVCVNPPDDMRPGYIGRPVADTSLRVVDDEGRTLGYDEPGELCVKGPQVMAGYWCCKEEKAFDADGWLHSGDIAVLSRDGFVRIVDRKKDMIVTSGFNVYPNEVEEVLTAHPQVSEAAVIGMPDEESGERVQAYIVARSDQLDAETLRKWCRERLTGYKVPRSFEFRHDLPRNNVGKILRRSLRDESL
ncbi:AMP-binding protein [Kushneria phosphatilytica]|uniref:Long-chain-fatty-acid--CoA ligase n=1 Tax=Kushneria phosphatilytica TaxID=657387 RepID=A0A1S1NV13_9GAMM|nr:AMP-binding protein [Kushneria phosphatilytica]OHV10251.1 long-chain fatty acid--CoA ligase [Kushneria phosphatilytica]QEL11550.1 AMP-binding protein [Kushneria phosphatilytica]